MSKTGTKLEDLPASVQIIPRALLDEQGATMLRDAVYNASGINSGGQDSKGYYDHFLIRGLNAQIYSDGFSDGDQLSGLSHSLNGVERVEILEGPGGSGATTSPTSRVDLRRIHETPDSYGLIYSNGTPIRNVSENAKYASPFADARSTFVRPTIADQWAVSDDLTIGNRFSYLHRALDALPPTASAGRQRRLPVRACLAIRHRLDPAHLAHRVRVPAPEAGHRTLDGGPGQYSRCVRTGAAGNVRGRHPLPMRCQAFLRQRPPHRRLLQPLCHRPDRSHRSLEASCRCAPGLVEYRAYPIDYRPGPLRHRCKTAAGRGQGHAERQSRQLECRHAVQALPMDVALCGRIEEPPDQLQLRKHPEWRGRSGVRVAIRSRHQVRLVQRPAGRQHGCIQRQARQRGDGNHPINAHNLTDRHYFVATNGAGAYVGEPRSAFVNLHANF